MSKGRTSNQEEAPDWGEVQGMALGYRTRSVGNPRVHPIFRSFILGVPNSTERSVSEKFSGEESAAWKIEVWMPALWKSAGKGSISNT